jgi:hypothetical protein
MLPHSYHGYYVAIILSYYIILLLRNVKINTNLLVKQT